MALSKVKAVDTSKSHLRVWRKLKDRAVSHGWLFVN